MTVATDIDTFAFAPGFLNERDGIGGLCRVIQQICAEAIGAGNLADAGLLFVFFNAPVLHGILLSREFNPKTNRAVIGNGAVPVLLSVMAVPLVARFNA